MPISYRQQLNPPAPMATPNVPTVLQNQLGSGIKLPPQIVNNVTQISSGTDKVKQDMLSCLAVPVNRRMGQCDYGSELPYMIFAQITQEFVIEIQRAVQESLTQWVPQINVVSVAVADYTDPITNQDQVLVIVQYTIKGTNSLDFIGVVSGNDGVVFAPEGFTVNGVPFITRFN